MDIIYFVLSVMFAFFIGCTWGDELERYAKYKDVSFKELFSLYDLGIIIFPLAWILGFLVAWFFTLLVYGEYFKREQRGIYKPLFKKKDNKGE